MDLLVGLSVEQKIALWSVIVVAIGIIVTVILHFWPKKKNGSKHVEVGRIEGDGDVVGDKAIVTVDKRQGINGELVFSKAMEVAEAKGRAEEQIEQLKDELAKAVQRIKKLEAEGNRPDAKKALEELRESGDMRRLQELLIKDKDEHRNALIQRNREIAAVAYLRGDIDVASEAVDEVLKLKPEDMFGLNQKGNIHKIRGQLDEAEDCCQRVLELSIKVNDDQAQAAALGNLGMIYEKRGELGKAEKVYKKSLEISKPAGMRELTANQYGNLGNVYRTRGKLDKAEEMLQKTIDIMKKIGNQEGMASAYGNLGLICQDRGDLDKAEEMHKKSLEIKEKLGLQEGMANSYGNLGNVYQTRGDLDKAEEMYTKILDIHKKLGHQEGMANDYGNLGLIYKKRGDVEKAREYWEKAVDLYKKIGMPHMVEKVEGWIGKLMKE